MFKWLNKQGVESDEGFIVQVIDRYHVEYREGENVLTLKIDIGFVGGVYPCVLLEKNVIQRWNSELSSSSFSDEKKQQILNRFIAAMMFQDMEVSIE
ncbi:hypothetical protein ACO0LD_13950 [Undibacterium sp. Ji83W]|uniref:hypothetical protein n=1 Tax=Undibacterium sp. Ji83W TaxID=3413043 RepID=UPI003BF245D6